MLVDDGIDHSILGFDGKGLVDITVAKAGIARKHHRASHNGLAIVLTYYFSGDAEIEFHYIAGTPCAVQIDVASAVHHFYRLAIYRCLGVVGPRRNPQCKLECCSLCRVYRYCCLSAYRNVGIHFYVDFVLLVESYCCLDRGVQIHHYGIVAGGERHFRYHGKSARAVCLAAVYVHVAMPFASGMVSFEWAVLRHY